MHTRPRLQGLMPLSVLAVLFAACSNDPGPPTAPGPTPARIPHGHEPPAAALDEVAVARARDVAATAGWTLVNPEALSRPPPSRRDITGLQGRDALDAIARDAGLRAEIAGNEVRFAPGPPHVAMTGPDQLDLLIVDEAVAGVLQQLAAASGRTLDMPPDLSLLHRVTLNFGRVPIRTALQLLADETGTRITMDRGAIRVRPRADEGS